MRYARRRRAAHPSWRGAHHLLRDDASAWLAHGVCWFRDVRGRCAGARSGSWNIILAGRGQAKAHAADL